jgi:hypothetical protein
MERKGKAMVMGTGKGNSSAKCFHREVVEIAKLGRGWLFRDVPRDKRQGLRCPL